MKPNMRELHLVYGVHPVIELLKAKRRHIHILYTTKPEPKAWAQIQPLLPKRPIDIRYVPREQLARLSETNDHQGIVAFADPFIVRKKPFEPSKQQKLIMLDGIQDTRNLGAILRSAHCTGIYGVVLTQKASAPINASTLKASAGLAEHLEIYQTTSALAAAQELIAAGYHVYIAALERGVDARTVTYQKPLCLVIGSEGAGVSREILSKGTVVTLPQKTTDISYNASVAAGILMFLASYGLNTPPSQKP